MNLSIEPIEITLNKPENKYKELGARVVVFNPKNQILILRRTSKNDTGKWDLPGGYIDPDEDITKGALRELVEETGINATEVHYLGSYSPEKNIGNWISFSFCHQSRDDVVTLSHEHDMYQWLDYQQARDLLWYVDLKFSLDKAINYLAPIFASKQEDIQSHLSLRERGIAIIQIKETSEFIIYDKKEKYQDIRVRFPGGGVDEGEMWEQAANRETLEEVGIDLKVTGNYITTVKHYYHWNNKQPNKITPCLDHYFYYQISFADWQNKSLGIEDHITCFRASKEYILAHCTEHIKFVLLRLVLFRLG